MEPFKPGRPSVFTQMIEAHMIDMAKSDVVSYEDLGKLTDLDCRPGGEGYSYVQTAIKRCERRGHNFANEKNLGYRKLTADETVDDIRHRQGHTRKRERRHLTKLEGVDRQEVSAAKKPEYFAACYIARITKRLHNASTRQKLIEEIKTVPDTEAIDYEKLTDTYLRKRP